MILTKAKESQLTSLNSGVTTETMQLSVSQSGNFWVDWADAFIKLCINKLGLEVEEGPGTSVGKVQQSHGPTRYQYDCDWNEDKGRIPSYDYQEVGFTMWEGISTWGNSLKEYGLDRINKRFDFILWFTTPSSDTRPEHSGERIGIRFKYPIITERGYDCKWFISRAPAIMPWYKNNETFNNERLIYNAGVYNGRTGVDTIYSTLSDNSQSYSSAAIEKIYEKVKYLRDANYHNRNLTGVFAKNTNYPWTHYSDKGDKEGEESYTVLGGYYGSNTPYATYKDYNIFQYMVSKTKDTIDLKVKNNNGEVLFDILYGNLMEEQVDANNIFTNSFVSLIVSPNSSYFSDWILTENNYYYKPSKMINRPTSIDISQRSYWGISRVLLEQQYVHCKDLYQVFSFSETMGNIDYARKVFVDKNNDEHDFILFNYGYVNNDTNRLADVLLAIPV